MTVTQTTVLEATSAPLDWNGRPACEIANGIMLMVYRNGSTHVSSDGALHIKFSDDYGATWTEPDIYLDGSAIVNFPMNPAGLPNEKGAEPWLITAPNGDLLVHMWCVDLFVSAGGAYQSRSEDGGRTWSVPAQIDFSGVADDTLVFMTEDHFVYENVIYASARQSVDAVLSDVRRLFVKSTDNGATWELVSALSEFADDANEVGIEYVGNNTIVAVFRNAGKSKAYTRRSSDMGVTWGALSDLTTQIKAIGRPRIWTRSHLRGESQWWDDPNLIMCGLVFADGLRRTALWFSDNSGLSWFSPQYVDAAFEDGGYGDVVYNPSGSYLYLSYRGTLNAAELVQYSFTLS